MWKGKRRHKRRRKRRHILRHSRCDRETCMLRDKRQIIQGSTFSLSHSLILCHFDSIIMLQIVFSLSLYPPSPLSQVGCSTNYICVCVCCFP